MAILKFLGEIDCFADLADVVGDEEATRAFKGKLNYFLNINDGSVFGVSDFAADSIFDSDEVTVV